MGPKRKYLSGKFGRLEIMWPAACDRKDTWYLCLCDCGTMLPVRQSNFTRKATRRTYSCGCWGKEKDITHGACVGGKTKEYRAYIQAKVRCTNEKASGAKWEFYGGRGIRFLFTSFEEFYAEIGSAPSPEHSLDRIENNGHYEIGNIRWATKSTQMKNRRRWATKSTQMKNRRRLATKSTQMKNRRPQCHRQA